MNNFVNILSNDSYMLEVQNLIKKAEEANSDEELVQIFGDIYSLCSIYKIKEINLLFPNFKIKIKITNEIYYDAPLIEFKSENSVMKFTYSPFTKDSAINFIKDRL